MTTTGPLTLTDLAADFREAAAQHIGRADAHRSTVEVRLTIDPALVADLSTAQRTLDRIAELIAAGDVHAASMVVSA